MLRPTKITGVITQGAKDFGHVQFVGSYKLAYSNNGERWFIYQDEKQKKDKVRFFLARYHVKHIIARPKVLLSFDQRRLYLKVELNHLDFNCFVFFTKYYLCIVFC